MVAGAVSRLIFFAISVVGALPVAASIAALDKSAAVSLVEERRYDDLDRQFNAAQLAYARGTLNDVQLLQEFRSFYVATPELETNFDEWVARYPNSYAARLARGIYYRRMGSEARGDEYTRQTSREQFARMRAYFEKATADLEASLELDPKPVLSYLYLLAIESNFVEHGTISLWGFSFRLFDPKRQLLDKSIRVAPDNFIVRRKYMSSLETRWGGSTKQMTAFLAECRSAKLSTNELKVLEGMVVADRAWVEYQAKNYRAAVEDYAQALEITGADGIRLMEYQMYGRLLQELAYSHEMLKEYAEAVGYLNKAIDDGADDARVYVDRGICLFNLGKRKEALDDYLRGAERGNAWAQNEVGVYYWHGVIFKRDKEEAIKWFSLAAKQGFPDAVRNLSWAQKL